ncbi:MAG: hypothetical protein PVG20_01100 [Thioalkalispiraceae bacterium]|jgi:hypothetical protein
MYNDTRLIDTDTDFDLFVLELKTPWKTMNHDMDTALKIITSHARFEMKLELLTVSGNGDELEFDFPRWQTEMEKTFVDQYGLNQGKLIFNKVMMRLYLMSKGSAQPLH